MTHTADPALIERTVTSMELLHRAVQQAQGAVETGDATAYHDAIFAALVVSIEGFMLIGPLFGKPPEELTFGPILTEAIETRPSATEGAVEGIAAAERLLRENVATRLLGEGRA